MKKGNLFPVLDIEYTRNRHNNSEIRQEVGEFCRVIKEHCGVNPIIYCKDDYYNKILKVDFKNFNYWILSLHARPKNDFVFWQYTQRGQVKDIGNNDYNRMNDGLRLEYYLLGDF